MNKQRQIYEQTKKKEERIPEYAKDLNIKRREGQEYEAGIIKRFNFLSKQHFLVHRDGHSGKIDEQFFTPYDADLMRRDGEKVSGQVELKGRPQWEGGDFPYPTVIINKNKIENAVPSSLIVWCNKTNSDCLWHWDLTLLSQFSTRPFEINKRKGMQMNPVYDIPVSFLGRGFDSLVKFFDRRSYENV